MALISSCSDLPFDSFQKGIGYHMDPIWSNFPFTAPCEGDDKSLISSWPDLLRADIFKDYELAPTSRWLDPPSFTHKGYDMPSTYSWSDAPIDILIIICEKLNDINDRIRFGVVCRHWGNVFGLSNKNIPPQLPVLMFPGFSCRKFLGRDSCCDGLLFIRDMSKYIIRRPVFIGKCRGSNHGWSVTIELMGDEWILKLVNPFLSSNNVIELPPIQAVPKHVITKGVLSHNPTWRSDYMVMLLYHVDLKQRLCLFRPGDRSWKIIYSDHWLKFLCDMICYKDEIYAVDALGKLLRYDTTSNLWEELVSTLDATDRETNIIVRTYLMESSCGELLCVQRRRVKEKLGERSTIRFRVYKFQTRGREWMEVNTLGGDTIFLADRSSVCLLASDWSMPNHIYFAGPTSEIGIFNLEDGCYIQSLVNGEVDGVWVQPTLPLSQPLHVCGARQAQAHIQNDETSNVNGSDDASPFNGENYDSADNRLNVDKDATLVAPSNENENAPPFIMENNVRNSHANPGESTQGRLRLQRKNKRRRAAAAHKRTAVKDESPVVILLEHFGLVVMNLVLILILILLFAVRFYR